MPGLADVRKWRFVLLGILASFGALWFLDFLFPETQPSLMGMYVATAVKWLVAFSLGGFVASRDFLVPAVVAAMLIVGGIVLHTAYWAGHYDLPVFPVIANNLPIFAVTSVAAAIGASIGMWLAIKVRRQAEVS
jgi:hypothetical protein